MVYTMYGTYVTLRGGCAEEIEDNVDVGDFFGVVKNACVCNPWVAFIGKKKSNFDI